MILSFGAKNFGCFKEQVDISFENKEGVSKLLCIEGANASGKTTILKILEFIRHFAIKSFNDKPDDEVDIPTHFNSSKTSDLYINFEHASIYYKYELTIKSGKIFKESLSQKKSGGRAYVIFSRSQNEIKKTLKKYDILKTMKLRSNASAISTAKQYDFSLDVIDAMDIFFDVRLISNLTKEGYAEHYFELSSYGPISSFLAGNGKKYLDRIKPILKNFDLGITDVVIESAMIKGKKCHYPVFQHGDNSLLYEEESTGTQTLFMTLVPYLMAMNMQGILIHDEFDTHLHHLLLPKLIDLIEDSDAQFIFTTFNIDIMDRLGKYKVYMVEKDNNESYAYRLDEIKDLRNDRPISNYYKKGLLGGVPR